MKIGLFFGSFNPVHTGHLIIAAYMAEFTELDKVWLVVSPHNPFKDKKNIYNAYDRLEMARLAVEKADHMEVSDVEFSLPKPSYTIDTLIYLKEKYPQHEFHLIMGSDNLATLKKWKNHEVILRDYRMLVYPRPGNLQPDLAGHPSVTITQTPLMELSSTFIRKSVAEGKNAQFFVPDKVLEFMDKKGLYRIKK